MGSDGAGKDLLESARAFRTRILAERERIEAERRIPDDLAKDLAREGFFRISVPEVYGGLDLTPIDGLEVYEEAGRRWLFEHVPALVCDLCGRTTLEPSVVATIQGVILDGGALSGSVAVPVYNFSAPLRASPARNE